MGSIFLALFFLLWHAICFNFRHKFLSRIIIAFKDMLSNSSHVIEFKLFYIHLYANTVFLVYIAVAVYWKGIFVYRFLFVRKHHVVDVTDKEEKGKNIAWDFTLNCFPIVRLFLAFTCLGNIYVGNYTELLSWNFNITLFLGKRYNVNE